MSRPLVPGVALLVAGAALVALARVLPTNHAGLVVGLVALAMGVWTLATGRTNNTPDNPTALARQEDMHLIEPRCPATRRTPAALLVAAMWAIACAGLGDPPRPTPSNLEPIAPMAPAAPIAVTATVCGAPTSLLVYPPSPASGSDLFTLADDHAGVVRGPGVTAAALSVYGWVVERTDGDPHFAAWWVEPSNQDTFLASLPDKVAGCEPTSDGFVKWDEGVVSVTLSDPRFRTQSGLGAGVSSAVVAAAAQDAGESVMLDETTIWTVGQLRFEGASGVVFAVSWSSR